MIISSEFDEDVIEYDVEEEEDNEEYDVEEEEEDDEECDVEEEDEEGPQMFEVDPEEHENWWTPEPESPPDTPNTPTYSDFEAPQTSQTPHTPYTPQTPSHNNLNQISKHPWRPYMEFAAIGLQRKVVKEYFIHENKEYILLANDSKKFRAKCRTPTCPWMVYAYVQPDGKTFRIYTCVNKHENCGIALENRHIDAQWMSQHFMDTLRRHPNLEYKNFLDLVKDTKYSRVSTWKFYRARCTVNRELEDSFKEQYAVLEDYFKQLQETNHGSTAKIQSNMQGDKRIFERCYVCLHSCKEGFKNGCRPFIGLDGCFLKGCCKGVLLAAIGIDASNNIFSIAYSVVEKEIISIWTWFIELVRDDLAPLEPQSFTFMSDRQKGLQNAVENIFNSPDSRFCVRHMHANFKKEFP